MSKQFLNHPTCNVCDFWIRTGMNMGLCKKIYEKIPNELKGYRFETWGEIFYCSEHTKIKRG
jgi:hypothetical protein